MRKLVILACTTMILSGCNQSADRAERHVERLMTRFDAEACNNARPERFGRMPTEEGEGGINVYGITKTCADDIRVGLADGGFEETSPSSFSLTLPSGSRETVLVTTADTDEIKVEWRTFVS